MDNRKNDTAAAPAAESNMVFLVGVFRSGTSLLHTVLNLHSQIALMFEADVWSFPSFASSLRLQHDWLKRHEFWDGALSRHGLSSFIESDESRNVKSPDDLYRLYGVKKGAKLIGDKSIRYVGHLRSLYKRYPGCAFIFLWRDPVEIFRSVIRGAKKEPHFRRRGMLNRLIFYEEEMLRQAPKLVTEGARVCHVTYPELTDNTEETCRKMCEFLGIEFEQRMLDISKANMSVPQARSYHDYLRQGKIERQKFTNSGEILDEVVLAKLQRYERRWKRLGNPLELSGPEALDGVEPSTAEVLGDKLKGRYYFEADILRRLLFEFLPLSWLRRYRKVKARR